MDETIRLTYGELAEARGITLAAARRMTLRHKWPKQLGNDGLTRVSVPASALARTKGDGTGAGSVDGTVIGTVDVASWQSRHGDQARYHHNDGTVIGTGAGGVDGTVDGTDDVMSVVGSFSDAIASLRAQLIREQERTDLAEKRADRAEDRANEAERRVRELQEKLEAEMTEHRRMVGLLAKQLSARWSWWPRRR